jgi:hypothetical protein
VQLSIKYFALNYLLNTSAPFSEFIFLVKRRLKENRSHWKLKTQGIEESHLIGGQVRGGA